MLRNLPQGLGDASDGRHQDERSSNLEDALIRLEEEQQRSGVNIALRLASF